MRYIDTLTPAERLAQGIGEAPAAPQERPKKPRRKRKPDETPEERQERLRLSREFREHRARKLEALETLVGDYLHPDREPKQRIVRELRRIPEGHVEQNVYLVLPRTRGTKKCCRPSALHVSVKSFVPREGTKGAKHHNLGAYAKLDFWFEFPNRYNPRKPLLMRSQGVVIERAHMREVAAALLRIADDLGVPK